MAFDPVFARDVVLALAQAAYAVMDGTPANLPAGYIQTSLIQADAVALNTLTYPHPAVAAMTKDSDIFGLMGRNPSSRTAFLAFRGTSDLAEWVADINAFRQDYRPISGFGQVHTGFQDVYELVRTNIAAELAATTAGCDHILLTGHSLGAALAVLAAPDIARAMPPNTIEPRLITFAGPKTGSGDFAASFNAVIESCYRVVNFLDLVPYLPPGAYVHVGSQISVDSGGPPLSISWRHGLAAYRDGLSGLVAAAQ
ncbi:lipase family protein [Mycobacterium sp.]|uniref:lipase family protein n=1 Tax=Mycobacterium sp. TaxID=1785 RepID=UPI0026011C05|nr:lipase family protein [Mycobacterium sp.]